MPVVDKARQVLGMISDGDLLARGGVLTPLSVAERFDRETLTAHLAEIRQAGKTAREVLTTPVVTVREDTSLAHAVSVMADHNLKRLPVVDKHGRLAGILSRQDVLHTVAAGQPAVASANPPPGAAQTVGDVMVPEVPTMPLDADLAEIVEKMMTSEFKRVIVVDGQGRAVGIINDGDLVARVRPEARPSLMQALRHAGFGLGRAEHLPNVPAAELMSATVLTGPAGTPIAEAVRQMLLQRRQRFVVVDEAGRPIGIVDRQRLLRAVAGR